MVNQKQRAGDLIWSIEQFDKTEHFIWRQWQRGIPDCLVFYSLQNVQIATEETIIIMISRQRLKIWKCLQRYLGSCNEDIFIIIRGGRLTTAYRSKIELGKFKHKKNSKIILIN